GGASVELLNDTTDDGTWSTTLPVSAGDGAYEVTILATDEVGKTSSITRNIVIDTESPDLTLTAPVDGEFIDSGSYTIRGQVTDNGGKGVTSLEYSTDNATWTTIPLSGFNWSVTGVDFSTGGEGNRTLYVRATDGLNPESSQQVDFYYDTADPSLSEDNYSAAQEITNGDFTFTGDVSDSNALKDTGALVITASKDGGASSQVYSRSAAQIAADGGSYSYTVVLPDDGSDDGTWVYTITATDVAGRTKSETRTFLIDETDPDTPVIDAFAGAYQVNELVSSGTAADGGSGLQTVEYSFDQSNWSPASGTSSWFRTVDISMSAANVNHRLGQGNRTLYVRAIDRAGNVSPVGSRSFTVDRADPVVTVDAEYDGTVYKNAGFTVNGTVTDSLQLAGSPIAITVDGPNTDDIALGAFNYTSGDGSWSQAVPIDDGDGSYSIAITGSDNVGRTHTVTRTVVVDTADPVVAVNNLNGDGSTQVNGATYTVSGTVTESGSGIASVEYSLDTTDGLDGTWQAATGTTSWAVALSGLTDTLTQTFAIRSTDNAGNTSTAVQREFIVDLAPPTLTESESGIANASIVYRNSAISLGGSASDANGVTSVVVTYSKDGGASVELLNDTTDDGTWSTTLPVSAGDGAYEVTILATDEVGKTSSITRNIVIDTESPDLTLTAPVDGEFIDSGSYTIRGQVTDNGGKGVTSLEYSTDNATWTTIPLSGFNWSVTGVDFSTGGEGNRTLYVRATDGLNPESSQQVDFYYDTADPSLSEDNYSAAQEITNGDFTFTGDVSDSNALKDTGALVITASKDGGASSQVYSRSAAQIAADGGSYSYTVVLPDDGSDDGTWVYTITATDVAGRTKSETRTFLIDETDPDTPVIDAFAGAYQVNELVSSGTAADGGSGLQTVEYSFDQSNWSPASGTSSWFRTVDISMSAANVNHRLGQGNRTLYVRAIDRAGNVSPVGSRSFTVDRADPVVTVDAEYDGTVYKNAGFTVNGTVTDSLQLAGSPIAITVDGPNTDDIALGAFNYTSGDGSWSQAVPIDDGDGSYSIAITGSDNVGRTHTVTRTVVVDTADPVVAVNNLNGDGSTQVNGATYTVSGTVTESGSGIASVEYSLDTTDGLDGTWQAATGTTSW
ncbi:beta strand repeat-containing protein, partial [Spirochaeta lutea]|uniref:beta strand repeat-containing protein n=1 Tax=Spirochaeta lutea TaxID=1480694 RepID=UPI00056A8454